MKKIWALLLSVLSSTALVADDISWVSPPYTLSTLSVDASDPHVSMDPDGNGVAVWIENGYILSAALPVGGSWSDTVTISNSGASSPKVAMDGSGNAIAVWLESGVVKTATQPLNDDWGTSVSLSGSGATSPQVAADQSGNIVVVWVSGGTTIQSATQPAGGNWPLSPDTLFSTGTSTAPQVAISANGDVVAVWNAVVSSLPSVYSAGKYLGGTWSTAQAISGSANSTGARIAMDNNGNATAIWFQYSNTGSVYSNVTVQAASQQSLGTWSSPVTLSYPGIYNPNKLFARIAYASNGNAIAVWNQSFDGSTFNVEAAVQIKGESWGENVDIVAFDLYSLAVDLTIDPQNEAIISFMYFDPSSSTIYIQAASTRLARYTQNQWSASTNLSEETNNAWPSIATSHSGSALNIVAVWLANNGTNNIVQTTTGADSSFLPPSNLSVTQSTNDFGVFTEHYNTLSWDASPAPDIDGYVIYRNSVLINVVDSSTLQIIDDNRGESESVTYGVAAFEGIDQSGTIYVTFP